MKNYKMWIGGQWVESASGKTYTDVNPATEEVIARLPLGGVEDVDRAVEAARKAFPIWSRKSPKERSAILNRIAASVNEGIEDLAQSEILDHGSPIPVAHVFAQMVVQHFKYAALVGESVTAEGVIKHHNNTMAYFQREPIGVCACITPWNFPLMVSAKIAAALAAGNTCVLKPPSICALPALKLAEILSQHDLPPGAVNVVTGPGNTVGEALASHRHVGMVAFTGSHDTGATIMAAASRTVKRLFMELGGKNPFIVLQDANVDAAVGKAAFASFFNSGMVCACPGRYYIHESVYDEFVSRFVAAAKTLVVGDPTDPKTQMGPVISAEHRAKVERYIQIGIKEGATLVLGGKRPVDPPLDKGYFVMPTVFADVTQNMTIAKEEIFGPVACFMRFSSEDDVIEQANDNEYGLSASVWTRNIAKARKFANALEAGTVWVNEHMGDLDFGLPWGGFKQSGYGKENDIMGQEEYTQVKVVSLTMPE
jgi:acyl-CoA reductase-like NAD-dependent aldehyde dehydrogenase